MKVVQINVVYRNGSTGKLVKSIHDYMQINNVESFVLYGRGAKIKDNNVHKFCGEFEAKAYAFFNRITGLYYGSAWFSTNKLIKEIKRISPDIINIHCINGHCVNIPRLLRFLSKTKAKVVITLHAEFLYTANCGHSLDCDKWQNGCYKCRRFKSETKSFFADRTKKSWNSFKKAFDSFDEKNVKVVSVSPWLMERASKSMILSRFNHLCIYNGVDVSRFSYKEDVVYNPFQVLFVTPFFTTDDEDIKGGGNLIKIAKQLPQFTFVVAGEFEKNIILPNNIKCLGRISNQSKLSNLYSQCVATLLLSKKETFSMVTIESLCCGTPIVGFKCGAPEIIAIKEYSFFYEQNDVESIIKALKSNSLRILNRREISNNSLLLYSDKKMGENYLNLYDNFIK